jgi:vesicle-associated membrane protein 7
LAVWRFGIRKERERGGKRAMAMMSNLVYYASVVRDRKVVLAEHLNSKDEDLSAQSVESLEKLPEFHNRFAYTMNKRMFMFLMEDSFTYTAIVDEALGKGKGFGFLERVRDEFQLMLRARGLDAARLEQNAMSADFGGVYKHLVKPLIGVPQKDLVEDLEVSCVEREDRGSGSPTQIGSPSHHEAGYQHHHSNGNGSKGEKKSKKDDQNTKMKEIMMTTPKASKYNEGGGGNSSSDMENGIPRKRGQARHVASKMWWRNVKRVLLLDLVVCCVLFAIWLGICRGFSCVKS